ncbi:MAG: SMP-30/gluconolactonase/LRE family protein [Salinibacterium sp.]|nr:SMP-30/gluconolactonase/LRE family protein [Salinibacterium sp.]
MIGNGAGVVDEAGVIPPGVELTCVVTGATWSEGPVWLADRRVLRFSDIPGNRILEVDPGVGELIVHRTDVEFTNGRTLDRDGRIIQCPHGRRAVEREVDGELETLVDSFNGRRLNSPNDVIVASDGAIWFTDPPYGIMQAHEGRPGEPEYGANYVFRFDPATSALDPAIIDMDEPNGLAFSPDESILYVADSAAVLRGGVGNHHVVAYDIHDGVASNGRVFAEITPGVPDGLRVDVEGRLWISSSDSVQVFEPTGERVAQIFVPEPVGNLCFGGPDGSTLFVAASTSIYSIPTLTRGAAS